MKIKRRTTQVHGKHTKCPPRSYNQELMTSRKSNEAEVGIQDVSKMSLLLSFVKAPFDSIGKLNFDQILY